MQESYGIFNPQKKPTQTETQTTHIMMAASFSDMTRMRFQEDATKREEYTCSDKECAAGTSLERANLIVGMCKWMFVKHQTLPADTQVAYSSLPPDEQIRVDALVDLIPPDKDVVFVDDKNNYHKFRLRETNIVVSWIRSDIPKSVKILFQ